MHWGDPWEPEPEEKEKENKMPELNLEIDLMRLHKECQGQSALRLMWGEKHADAGFKVDEAKSALDVVKAEQDQEIRGKPEKYGLTKTTEAVIGAAVLLTPAVQKATNDLHIVKHTAALLAAAVSAIDDRRRQLTNLVELHGQNYWSEPAPQGVKKRKKKKDKTNG